MVSARAGSGSGRSGNSGHGDRRSGGVLVLRDGHAVQAPQHVGRRLAVGATDGDRFGETAGTVENV